MTGETGPKTRRAARGRVAVTAQNRPATGAISRGTLLPWLALVVVLLLASPGSAQVRVTPDSHLENAAGEEITYDRFVELMGTGHYVPRPIEEDGAVIGYRLAERGGDGSAPQEDSGVWDRPMTGPIRGVRDGAAVPMEAADGRLLVPVTLHGRGSSLEASLIFDTGTFAPVIWLPEMAETVGELDSLSLGPVTVERPVTGSFGAPDALRRSAERARRAALRLGERPVAGIMGWSLVSELVVSLDVAGGRLVLRPPDTPRRTLREREPVAAADFRRLRHNVWIPARVNGEEGYVHLDTGSPHTEVDDERVRGTVRSYVVGGTDLLPHLSNEVFHPEDQGKAYRSVPLEVVADLGVDALGNLIVTLDGPRGRIYFESPGGGEEERCSVTGIRPDRPPPRSPPAARRAPGPGTTGPGP